MLTLRLSLKPRILLLGWLMAQQMGAEVPTLHLPISLTACRYHCPLALAYPLGRLHEYAYVSSW